jgi:hypothetical protein
LFVFVSLRFFLVFFFPSFCTLFASLISYFPVHLPILLINEFLILSQTSSQKHPHLNGSMFLSDITHSCHGKAKYPVYHACSRVSPSSHMNARRRNADDGWVRVHPAEQCVYYTHNTRVRKDPCQHTSNMRYVRRENTFGQYELREYRCRFDIILSLLDVHLWTLFTAFLNLEASPAPSIKT